MRRFQAEIVALWFGKKGIELGTMHMVVVCMLHLLGIAVMKLVSLAFTALFAANCCAFIVPGAPASIVRFAPSSSTRYPLTKVNDIPAYDGQPTLTSTPSYYYCCALCGGRELMHVWCRQ